MTPPFFYFTSTLVSTKSIIAHHEVSADRDGNLKGAKVDRVPAIVDLKCNAGKDELTGIATRVRAAILERKYAGNEIAPGTKLSTESAVAIDHLCEQAATSQFNPVDKFFRLYMEQRWGRAVEDGAPLYLLPICDEPESPASHQRISPRAWRIQVSASSGKNRQQDQQTVSHSHDLHQAITQASAGAVRDPLQAIVRCHFGNTFFELSSSNSLH